MQRPGGGFPFMLVFLLLQFFIFLSLETDLVTAVKLNSDKLCHVIVMQTNTF